MFKIYDGRETFYQWDINQKLIVADDSITEVHFSNRTNSYSLVCDIQNEGDLRVVSVPNVLLQTNWPIKVYAYLKDHTEVSETFRVIEKDKPEDYIYTPDEVKTWEELNNRITELEQSESVLYTAQSPTEEQKAQARQNIGSFDFFEIPNLIKFNVKSKPIFGDKIVEGQVFALNDFQPIDIDTADAETIEAWRIVYNYFSLKPMQKFVSNISALQALALLIDKNMLGENFYSTYTYPNYAWLGRNKKFIKVYSYYSNDAEKKAIAGFVYDLEQSLGQFIYNVLTNEIEYFTYSCPLTAVAATSTDGKELISQTNMRADPTNDMEIATKHYVDNSIATNSVLYTAQSLTEEQKEQARKNIGAQDENNGLTPVTVTYINPFYNTTDTSTTYLLQGTLKVFDDNSPTDVKKAFAIVMNVLGGHANPTGTAGCRDLFDKFRILYDNGLITIPFKAYPNKYDRNYWVSLSAYQNKYIFFNCVRSDKADGFNVTLRYDLETNAYVENSCYSEQAVKSSLKGLTGTPTIMQVQMRADPTEPMQIATKQYVDNAPIKKASATELGGIKVGTGLAIADDGTLSINIASAAVGQTIKVKAVDENGKPTEWEAVDMPSGESSFPKFEKLLTHTITEEEIATNPAAFMWNTTQIPNLNDFNVFTLTIRNPDDTTKITFTKWVRLKINNVLMGNICGTTQGESYRYSISANRLYGFWVSGNMYNPNNNEADVLTPPYSRVGFDTDLAASEAVTSIGFTSYVGDYGLTAGIVVEIWGAK